MTLNKQLPIWLLLCLALVTFARNAFATKMSNTCPAVENCLARLNRGGHCTDLPVPQRARLTPIPNGQLTEVRKLRKGVWLFRDMAYNSLIVRHERHLVVIDMPDAGTGVNKPDGSRTRLTDAVLTVMTDKNPKRIDMVYSHSHYDHIGAATRFYQWARRVYPKAVINIYGGEDVKEFIDNSISKRAIAPTRVVHKFSSIKLTNSLRVDMTVLGGHSKKDLAVLIPRTSEEKGILMFVDVVFPRWAPFWAFAVSEDVTRYISVHTDLLKFHFDIFIDGHMDIGNRNDVSENLEFTKDLLGAAEEAIRTTTPEEYASAGAGRAMDPSKRQFGNLWYGFITAGRNVQANRCARIMIERWGCRFGGVATTAFSHCFMAITYRSLSL